MLLELKHFKLENFNSWWILSLPYTLAIYFNVLVFRQFIPLYFLFRHFISLCINGFFFLLQISLSFESFHNLPLSPVLMGDSTIVSLLPTLLLSIRGQNLNIVHLILAYRGKNVFPVLIGIFKCNSRFLAVRCWIA